MVTVIQDVSVVPMAYCGIETHQDVVIDGNKIRYVTPTGTRYIGAKVVDGAGKYLFPGLADMHVHMLKRANFPELFLLNGVTFARDMGARENIFAWKRENVIGRGYLPDFRICGSVLEGLKSMWDFSIKISGEEQAKETVGRLGESGADFIKLYHTLDEKDYVAAGLEARRMGLQVAGHPHLRLDMRAQADFVDSFEHADMFLVRMKIEGESNPAKYARKVAPAIKEKGKSFCPTAFLDRRLERSGRDFGSLMEEFREEIAYMRADVPGYWKGRLGYLRDMGYLPTERSARLSIEFTREMHKSGVRLLAGTDVGNPFVFPGSSIHEEIGCLINGVGLSVYDALRTATVNAGDFIGNEAGTIENGKLANIVLVEKNPLQDPETLKRPTDVFVHGRHFGRAELEGRLVRMGAG